MSNVSNLRVRYFEFEWTRLLVYCSITRLLQADSWIEFLIGHDSFLVRPFILILSCFYALQIRVTNTVIQQITRQCSNDVSPKKKREHNMSYCIRYVL